MMARCSRTGWLGHSAALPQSRRFWGSAALCPSHPTTRARRKRGAFTLLELLLASALTVTLMTTLWVVLDMYGNLFERGQSQTEQAQLVRSLAQQFTEDLHGAIQDPPPGSPPRTASDAAVRRFGLSGTSDTLRVDVLQIPPFGPGGGSVGSSSTARPDPLEAPELRTIYYTFQAVGGPAADSSNGAPPSSRPGLVRREEDFETPAVATEEDPSGGFSLADASFDGTSSSLDGPPTTFDELLSSDPDSSLMWAPEVVGLKFRYYDGSGWQGEWNSLARKGLPVVVEMTVQLLSFDDAETNWLAAQAAGGGPSETTDSNAVADVKDLAEPTEHRIVVHLPGSPLYRPPRRVDPQPAGPPAVRPAPRRTLVPRPAPRPRVQPAPAKPRPPAEQWMRSGS